MEKGIFRGAAALAAYTGFSENAIHILVARGGLPVHRHGRRLIFIKEEIDAFFTALPGVTAAEARRASTPARRRGVEGSAEAAPGPVG